VSGGCVATASVATGAVATGFGTLGNVAAGSAAGSPVTDGSIGVALLAAGGVAVRIRVDSVVVDGVAWGRNERVCGAHTCVLPGLAEPLAGRRSPGRCNSPAGVVGGVVVTLPSDRELGVESTAVRIPSTRLRGPDSNEEPVRPLARSAEALLDSFVAVLVAASVAFAQTRKADAMAVTVRPAR
jgi:hypothetical protein